MRFLTFVILQNDGQETQTESKLQPDKRPPQSPPSRMIERRAAVSRIGIGIGIGIAIAIAIGTGTGTVAVAVAVATAAAPAGCAGTSHTTAEQRPQQW